MSGPLGGFSAGSAALIVAVGALSVAVMFAKMKSWGVGLSPIELAAVLLRPSTRRTRTAKTLLDSAAQNVFGLRRAGAWCGEGAHVAGRALVLYGFAGLAVSSILAYIASFAQAHTLTEALLGLEAASAAAFGCGGLTLLLRRAAKANIRAVTHADTWAIHTLSVVLGAICALSSIYGALGAQPEAYVLHLLTLAAAVAYLGYAPFSELTFLVWKGALITLQTVGEGKTEEAGGGGGRSGG